MAKKRKESDTMAMVRALFEESGLSLAELGRRMGYPVQTARQSAWQFMKTADPRFRVLQRFADAMGIPHDDLVPTRKEKGKMKRKLEDELMECNCAMDGGRFRELLEERRATKYPSWTIDELVCHPDDAKEFCKTIRTETDCPGLADDLILRTLMNVRRAH
jgi:transcriptional regulator with XRE-family HTH domain